MAPPTPQASSPTDALGPPPPAGAASPGYTLLVGAGKSGTKRVMRILNASERTYCRCEPNAIPGSPYGVLPDRETLPVDDGAMERSWDELMRWTATSMGERDPMPWPRKRYERPASRVLPLFGLLRRRRLRRALGAAAPAWAGPQWPTPSLLARREDLLAAPLVIKTGPAPAWADWVLRRRSAARVLHVVRHPAGFLNSYRARWLAVSDVQAVAVANRRRLERIGEQSRDWRRVFGPTQAMSAEEAELWYWRYSVEMTHRAGEGSDRYLLVRDEDVAADASTAAGRILGFCSLPRDGGVDAYLRGMAAHWRSHLRPWQELVDAPGATLVERVLEGSELRGWWKDQEQVSTFSYSLV